MSSTYTTMQGDKWDMIAYTQLGSSDYTDLLIRANLAYHTYYIFPAGIVLTLPTIPATITQGYPPWKQVTA